jgi:putative ABC transport system permease protein
MVGSILRIIGSLVAGLVIFIIIFVDIVNKRRQVGILKAIGVRQKTIIQSYIIRGVFYAFLGSVFGYLLMRYGIIGAFERKPIDMPMADVVPLLKEQALTSSVIFFIMAGFIGSAIPAVKEIKKKILDLLYH